MYWKGELPFPSSLDREFKNWESKWHHVHEDNKSARQEGRAVKHSIPGNMFCVLVARGRDCYPNIHRQFLTSCTLPVTSAEAERSFH